MKSTSTKSQKPESERRERQDWLIVLLILLLGFMCVICAGQSALRFVPNWKLDANMQSGIEPNSNVQPAGFIEPIDPGILTQPAWVKVFLTPGAKFVTGTPPPAGMPVNKTPTAQATSLVPVTNTVPVITLTGTIVPTNTIIWLPLPATAEPRDTHVSHNTAVPPANTPVNTSPPSGTTADLSITKDDGTGTYTPGGILTYTITVTNNGPDSVSGATVVDNFPFTPGGQITSANWTCAGAACPVPPNGTGNINSTLGNLPAGSSAIYTVNVNINPGASGNLSNSATVTAPAGVTDAPGNNADDDIDSVAAMIADLGITNSDGQTWYDLPDTLNYTMTVTNGGPAAVNGATVANTFTGNVISTIDWTCTGAACPAGFGSGNINAVLGNLVSGGTVTYNITVVLFNTFGDDVVSNASVSVPGGYTDPGPLPNSANDSTVPLVQTTGRDCPLNDINCLYNIPDGGSITLYAPIDVEGAPDVGTWDLVYYERWHPWIFIDRVQIEIGDGTNWYTVFYWGDGNPNPNTIIAGIVAPLEPDKYRIEDWQLYGQSGVAIDVDDPSLGIPPGSGIPPGTYDYVRITARGGGANGGDCGVDGIEVLP